MAQIFISYSTKDQKYADEVVQYLEKYGYTCFIATRDIQGGEAFDQVITQQLSNSETLFLLLFSQNSDKSNQVKLEVSLAFRHELTILPFRLQNVTPIGLDYFLQFSQWIDIAEGDRYHKLLSRISKLIKPQISYKDDNEQFLVEFFAKYGVYLAPNQVICNANYNRYVLSYKSEQARLMTFLLPSLKYTFGYFSCGRMMLEDKFPCLFWLDEANCQLLVDVSTNDTKVCSYSLEQIAPNEQMPCQLMLGFDVNNQPAYLDLRDSHLFVNNCTYADVLQLRTLLKHSLGKGKQACKVIFSLNKIEFDFDDSFDYEEFQDWIDEEILPEDKRIGGAKFVADEQLDKHPDIKQVRGLWSGEKGPEWCGVNYEEVIKMIISTVCKRRILFDSVGAKDIFEYEKTSVLQHVVLFLYNVQLERSLERDLDYLINVTQCEKYGIHIVQAQTFYEHTTRIPDYFANCKKVQIAHFLHEHKVDAKTSTNCNKLVKAYVDMLVGKSHVVVPDVFSADDTPCDKLRLVVPCVGSGFLRYVNYFKLLPQMTDFNEKYFEFEYAIIGDYKIHWGTFRSVMFEYAQLGIVELKDNVYHLVKDKYDSFVNELYSL